MCSVPQAFAAFFINLRFHEKGETQKHQSKGAASLDSQQDSSADGTEGARLRNSSHRSRIVKGAGIHISNRYLSQ